MSIFGTIKRSATNLINKAKNALRSNTNAKPSPAQVYHQPVVSSPPEGRGTRCTNRNTRKPRSRARRRMQKNSRRANRS